MSQTLPHYIFPEAPPHIPTLHMPSSPSASITSFQQPPVLHFSSNPLQLWVVQQRRPHQSQEDKLFFFKPCLVSIFPVTHSVHFWTPGLKYSRVGCISFGAELVKAKLQVRAFPRLCHGEWQHVQQGMHIYASLLEFWCLQENIWHHQYFSYGCYRLDVSFHQIILPSA